MTTLQKKIEISIYSGLIFLIVNLPDTYKLTSNIFDIKTYNKCPTKFGLVLHTIIFACLTYLSMYKSKKDIGIKIKHTIYGTLIYYLLSSHGIYYITGQILGKQYANDNGCPTLWGILLHTFLYILLLIGIMYLPEKNK